MFKVLCLVALLGVASAQRWPMITVNAAGEIVLQSLTRAQSFQITPALATTAPSSGTTASLSTASLLLSGVSAYVVTTATSPATGHGVTLPAPIAGNQVTLIQSQTSFVSYTIWSSASSVFINNDSTSVSITVWSRRVTCSAVSTTRWNCVHDTVDAILGKNNFAGTISTSTAALNIADSGSLFTIATGATATTITLPTCTAANIGASYYLTSTTTTAAITVLSSASDTFVILGNHIVSATAIVAPIQKIGSTGVVYTPIVYTAGTQNAAATGGSYVSYRCINTNTWIVEGYNSVGAIL